MIHQGDCLDVLKKLEDCSVDALVTDPPAGISFMGKAWDDDKGGRRQWIDWMSQVMTECMRVLKPGAHGLVWAIPRTSHWTATALEDAGFEIRDVVTHLFGSGFPKSLDISKAIVKSAVISSNCEQQLLAKEWQGWGTALKPASEHWILVRKPLSEKNVASNVAKWGTGGINIDGCRIEFQSDQDKDAAKPFGKQYTGAGNGKTMGKMGRTEYAVPSGRFPANLVLSCMCEDDQHDMFCPVAQLDEQSGSCKSGGASTGRGFQAEYVGGKVEREVAESYTKDQGTGASRFFYVAKPSKRERNAGCEDLPVKQAKGGGGGIGDYLEDVDSASGKYGSEKAPAQNHHPTVKPIKLMRYLIRMITPRGGLVLDPFTGSGTTGVAAVQEGMRFVGIEREPEYTQIAEKRIYHAFPEFKKDVSHEV